MIRVSISCLSRQYYRTWLNLRPPAVKRRALDSVQPRMEMFYNCAMFCKSRLPFLRGGAVLMLLVLCCLAASCEYPEEGYYQLDLLDSEGEVFGIFPFYVQELVDDTHLTYGFAMLVPQAGLGKLVEVEIRNGEDLSRRYWLTGMTDIDSHAGDIALELTHAQERLSFKGAYRPWPTGSTFSLGGYILPGSPSGTVVVNGPVPPVPFDVHTASRIEIRRIDKADFEDFLGSSVEEAERVKAQSAPVLLPDAADEDYSAGPPKVAAPRDKAADEPKRNPPPMGGR